MQHYIMLHCMQMHMRQDGNVDATAATMYIPRSAGGSSSKEACDALVHGTVHVHVHASLMTEIDKPIRVYARVSVLGRITVARSSESSISSISDKPIASMVLKSSSSCLAASLARLNAGRS
mmetsp:Transcript_36583/g.67600  ORF Transcript_36583/g.67600 Transcript_36583/m.67600 type:complete len:121 (+) Transcript_36583:98-460(+)